MGPFFVVGIHTHIANQQIDQAVVVVVKEDSPGGVSDQAKTRFLGNIFKVALTIVLEENISLIDGRHVKIFVTRVVDIRKRCSNANAIFQTDTGLLRNILKFSIA